MPRTSRSAAHPLLAICLIATADACVDIDLTGLETLLPGACTTNCGSTWPYDIPVIAFDSQPVRVAGGLSFTSLSVGPSHVCGVTVASVFCWGDLGMPNEYRPVSSPEAMAGTAGLARISAGGSFTCGVELGGRAVCWGANGHGELGNGELNTRTPAPMAVLGSRSFRSIATSDASHYAGPHACALTASGAAYCWGHNALGNLGNGGTAPSTIPVGVSGDHVFESISLGTHFTCGIVSGGAAFCWGDALHGVLGDDPRQAPNCSVGAVSPHFLCSTTPVRVPGGHAFAAISAGDRHACALDLEGSAFCWGSNVHGQRGAQGHDWGYAPARIAGPLRFTAIAAGASSTCALTTSREAHCWGDNSVGQLGDGTTIRRLEPTKVATDLPFVAIDVGDREACALTPDGTAYCWGSNQGGKLGKGS